MRGIRDLSVTAKFLLTAVNNGNRSEETEEDTPDFTYTSPNERISGGKFLCERNRRRYRLSQEVSALFVGSKLRPRTVVEVVGSHSLGEGSEVDLSRSLQV